jgi:hypothetical protein
MKRLGVVVAGLALAWSACSCEPAPVDCTDTTLTFESPTPGVAVDAPFEVTIALRDPTGAAFNFETAKLSVAGTDYTGTVSGHRATFAAVSPPAGEQTLTATITNGSCQKQGTSTVTVREQCATPKVTLVSFPQDTGAPLGVLTSAELPQGTNLQVRVAAECTTGVQVRILRGTTEVAAPVSFSNGVATLTTTLPDATSASYELFAELVKNGAAANTRTGNPEALGTAVVDRTPPACAITTSGRFGPSGDQDPNTTGYQMRVTGTMDQGASGELAVTGQGSPVMVSPAMGMVSADITLPATGTATYTATLTCRSASGNTATATGTFTVDLEAPVVSITSPVSADGGNPLVTNSPLSLVIAATGAEDGSTVIVRRNGMQAASGTVTNGAARVEVPFGAEGTFTLEVRVTDAAGNTGTATTTVDVTLAGCGAAFSRPMQCPALLTPAQLSNGTYSFQTTSKAACATTSARLFKADVLADGGVGTEAAAGTATLTAAGVANFAPLTMASGDFAFRAEVDNVGVDAGISHADCRVTVDLDGPAITNPVVPSNATFATINAAQDTQPAVAGVQRTLQFSARVPMGGRVDVCTTQGTDPVSGQARQTSAECGAGYFVLATGVTSPANGFTFPEGTYSIKIVVVGGGLATAPASAPVPVFVDGTRPCVNALTRALPQDANADGRLNIAELNGQAPRLEFELNGACGDSSPATLSTTTPVVVRDLVNGAVDGVRASSATFGNGKYTVTLTGTYTAEVNLDLFIELTDLAGNRNLYSGTNDGARMTFRVDPVAPSCDLQSPSASQTLLGLSEVTGGMFPVRVGTALDVGTNGVRVTFGSAAARDVTPANGLAETTYSVTGTATYAVAATCTDESGNATPSANRNVTIDLDPPTCTINAPTAMTYSINSIPTSVTVTGAEGRSVAIRSSAANGTPLATLTVNSGSASGTVAYPNGTQTVSAEVSDAAGNVCTATVANVVVNSTACGLTFTSGEARSSGTWFNRSNTGSLTATTGVISVVTANSADCRSGQTVTLVRTAPTAGTPQTTTTPANGNVSFANVAVADGEIWSLSIDNGAGIVTTRIFRVGLRVPTAGAVTLNSFPVTSGQPLFFVAPTGNINLEPAAGTPKSTTYFADQSAGTAGAQATITVADVNGTTYATDTGTLQVLYGASVVETHTINAQPFSLGATQLTLPHNTTGQFVVRVTSAAGNSVDVVSNAGTVDVIAPAVPSVGQTLTSARAATVTLTWSPVYDDGSDSASGGLTGGPSTQLAGYDVRWTTSSVPANNAMATVADYFGASSKQDGITSWVATGITKPLTVPPLNTYYIGVRARDEVGNYSTFTAPTGLSNMWTLLTISNPSTDTTASAHLFGQHVIGGGSLNSDTVADLVVAAPNRGPTGNTNRGSVFIYYGGVSANTSTCVAPACQELQPYDDAAGLFGTDLSMSGNVGDLAAEAKPDLVVAQPTFQSTVGRAFLYFGTSTATISATNYIEFRGATGSNFASAARIIKDIDGDGLDELAVSAHGENAGQGRLYIFKGRSADPAFNPGMAGANWFNSRTAMDGSGNLYVPSSAATWVLEGPTPVDTGGNQFARLRWGLVTLGDITGDGRPDFVVPLSKDNANGNKVALYSGSLVAGSTVAVPFSSALQVLQAPGPYANTNTTDGFGRTVAGGAFVDSSLLDLVVGSPRQNRVYGYADLTSTGFSGASPTFTISGPAGVFFGLHLSNCDLNGDGRQDLVIAEIPFSGANGIVAWQRQSGGFESTIDGVNPSFDVSRVASSVSGTRLGRISACVDGSGDATMDLVLGDEGTGRVLVYR